MKNKDFRIITLIIFLVLLLALIFRWDKGPTLSDQKGKTIHMRDRWAGQMWTTRYDSLGVKTTPAISEDYVVSRISFIMDGPVIAQKKQELENTIKEQEEIKKANQDAWYEYARYYEEWENRPKTSSGLRPLQFPEIPKDIKEGEYRHVAAESKIKKAKDEINRLPILAEDIAGSEYITYAWKLRNMTTLIWYILMGATLITAFLLIKHRPKKE